MKNFLTILSILFFLIIGLASIEDEAPAKEEPVPADEAPAQEPVAEEAPVEVVDEPQEKQEKSPQNSSYVRRDLPPQFPFKVYY